MRLIKFRIWNGVDFVNPDEFQLDDLNKIQDNGYSVMQFTGLHDKNGIEIYEGDILKTGDAVNVVEWKHHGWVATWTRKRTGRLTVESGSPDLGYRPHEVIGNIYEHPTLLED